MLDTIALLLLSGVVVKLVKEKVDVKENVW